MEYRPLTTTLKVTCSACGQQGGVAWGRPNNPSYPDKLQLLELSEGFVAVEISAKDALRILCGACRVPVVMR